MRALLDAPEQSVGTTLEHGLIGRPADSQEAVQDSRHEQDVVDETVRLSDDTRRLDHYGADPIPSFYPPPPRELPDLEPE